MLEGDAQGDHRGPFFFALRGELGPDGKPGKVKGCKTKNGVVVQVSPTFSLLAALENRRVSFRVEIANCRPTHALRVMPTHVLLFERSLSYYDLQGNHKEYLFRSESAEQVKDWVQCIEINLTQIKGNHGFNFAESYIRNSSLPRRSHIEDVALSP